MSSTDTTTTATSPPPPPPPATTTTTTTQTAWHNGTDAETIGFWQNKGYKVDDPKELATALTKNYRELERHMGAPPESLLRMPKADAKPEDIKAFWGKLGAGEAKDYDLSNIKIGDKPLDAPLLDGLKSAFADAMVPKDKATTIATKVAKIMEESEKQAATLSAAKVAEGKAKLAENWKNNYDFNHLKAIEGARRLGISPEAVKALENVVGYADVMEAMRRVGMATREDTFIERGATTGGVPTTREGAIARKEELMKDNDWAGRYLKGGVAEKREMDALNIMIDGDAR